MKTLNLKWFRVFLLVLLMQLALGKIVREQGILGWCQFHLFNPDSKIFKKGVVGSLKLDGLCKEEVLLEEVKNKVGIYYVKFDFSHSPEEVKKWRQALFYVEASAYEALSEDQYYLDSLIGFKVTTQREGFLGHLVGYTEHAGVSWLVIKDEKSSEQLVPWTDQVFEKIDTGNKTLILLLPEGLVDLWKSTS